MQEKSENFNSLRPILFKLCKKNYRGGGQIAPPHPAGIGLKAILSILFVYLKMSILLVYLKAILSILFVYLKMSILLVYLKAILSILFFN